VAPAYRHQSEPRPNGLRGSEAAIYRARARRLGLPFVNYVHLGPAALTSIDAISNAKIAKSMAGEAFIAPAEETMPEAMHWLNANPSARPRIAVATPTAIRSALRETGAAAYLAGAVARLEATAPDCSARKRLSRAQAVIGAAACVVFILAIIHAPKLTLTLAETAAAGFFLLVACLRFIAATHVMPRPPPPSVPHGEDLPVYTILVPLRHEAHMLEQLLHSLDRLAWPRDRLDVKLIIDADDIVTLRAARALAREPPYEVVEVPPGGPQTKPMALQYALSFARGEFVTVYDAEDRPHPGQIAEAHARFRDGPARLACLQAPLVIDNAEKSAIAALFAVEYATLFDGLLPAMARLGLPLPLGGTSNHFRRAALEEAGGWDPFNVTEDADLGIRLARFGYDVGTLTLPTHEEAPTTLRPWLRQRTRWMKGWLHTWLVHMRHPFRLWRALGTRQMVGFQALGLGMIVSALAHPIFLAVPFLVLFDPGRLWSEGGILVAAIAGLSLFNLAAGYAAMATLATTTLAFRGREALAAYLYLLPLYWLLMALACLLAVAELMVKPHHWNKTPHVGRPLRNRTMAEMGKPAAPEQPLAPPAAVARRA
jgi:cellulose synthase/poly-beta-1,6-N-acetylglucosamine synthase-like glycosyltransferase